MYRHTKTVKFFFGDCPFHTNGYQLHQARMHPIQIVGGEPARGEPGLVRHHTDVESCGTQSIQRSPGTRHRTHPGRIAVVRNVLYQGAVPVKQDRVEQTA